MLHMHAVRAVDEQILLVILKGKSIFKNTGQKIRASTKENPEPIFFDLGPR